LSKPNGNILQDVLIRLKVEKSRREYPELLRLVRARVEVNVCVRKSNRIYRNASSVLINGPVMVACKAIVIATNDIGYLRSHAYRVPGLPNVKR
jgi:hypothetical protein